jgi:hypothetical protein
MLLRRLRARAQGERGFSIIETVVAITVIFASLTALAFTATNGFKYVALSRERQAATGIANQMMEGMRAIAWDRFTKGSKTADLAASTDTNVKKPGACSVGASDYWYLACPNAIPPTNGAEKLVTTPNLPDECTSSGAAPCPLVPNTGTISGSGYPTTYTWKVYVTNNDATKQPYKVYVIVSWVPGAIGSGIAKQVTLQTLFTNPGSCGASATHPYAGACQPLSVASSVGGSGSITITQKTPGFGSANFTSASLVLPGARSEITSEQTSQLAGSTTQASVGLVPTSGSASSLGGSVVSSGADGNPLTTGVPGYNAPAALVPAANGTLTATNAGNSTTLSVTNSGDSTATGSTVSTAMTASSATTDSGPCPISGQPFTAESPADGLPCGASTSRLGASLKATLDLTALASGWPAGGAVATLAQVDAPASGTQSIATYSNTNTTTETAVIQQVTRNLGNVSLITFPSVCTTFPAGWDNTKGMIQLVKYADSATASAGLTASTTTVAAISSASGPNAVNVNYYNGSGYTTLSKTSSPKLDDTLTYGIPTGPLTCTGSVGSPARTLQVDISFPNGALTRVPKNSSTTGTNPRTNAVAQLGSPVLGTVEYKVTYNNLVKVDLLIDIDLGTIVAKSTYTAAPVSG